MHLILWEFRPKPGLEREFEAAYGPEGAWARLFASDPEHRGTDLLCAQDGRYVTIDRWKSAEAWESFRARRREEYEALDHRFEALTAGERHMGSFTMVERRT